MRPVDWLIVRQDISLGMDCGDDDGDSMIRIRERRFRSQRRIVESEEEDIRVLKGLETARWVMGVRWPKREPLDRRSIVREVEIKVHTVMVQSMPAVIRVLESAKMAHET